MKHVKWYIPNVLLTFLLVFLIIGCEATMLAGRVGLNPRTYGYITEQQQLDAKGYETLTSYFRTRSNSTGIPETEFLDAYTQEFLRADILANSRSAIRYLTGEQESFTPEITSDALKSSVRTFLETYADENGYEKDDVFETKVQSVIAEAEAKILSVADPFKFCTIQQNGWLTAIRRYVGYLNPAAAVCIALSAVTLALLVLCNRKQEEHLCYWIGLAALTAGLLIAAPFAYLTATDYFSGFAVKDPQIFAAVVGLLQLMTSRGLTMAVITGLVGLIGIAGFIFLREVQREDET